MQEDLSGRSDEDLARLVQGNNQEAFAVLMDRYQKKLLRYGRRFLMQTDHIEDVVQDVFIKAYENMNSFDATRRFSPWIYRIAHNSFLTSIRNRKHEPLTHLNLDELVGYAAYEHDAAEEQERAQMHALLEQGLGLLPPHYKEILILYYLEEQSYQDIADILHIPTSTVGVRLRRARESLKKHLTQNEG